MLYPLFINKLTPWNGVQGRLRLPYPFGERGGIMSTIFWWGRLRLRKTSIGRLGLREPFDERLGLRETSFDERLGLWGCFDEVCMTSYQGEEHCNHWASIKWWRPFTGKESCNHCSSIKWWHHFTGEEHCNHCSSIKWWHQSIATFVAFPTLDCCAVPGDMSQDSLSPYGWDIATIGVSSIWYPVLPNLIPRDTPRMGPWYWSCM